MLFDIHDVRKSTPKTNKVIVYWLGGMGFVFKFFTSEVVCVDPYLSDCVERIVGFRRLSLCPIKDNQLAFDVLLLSHDHPDHLDPDSFDPLTSNNPDCKIIGSGSCDKFLRSKTIDYQIVTPGNVIEYGKISIEAVSADHGDLCPQTVGFMIRFANRSLYFTSDTCLNYDLLAKNISAKPEILITCINGAFGNLDETQAATLTKKCNAKVVIPGHFWLFAEHGGDPGKFREQIKQQSPETEIHLLKPGRGVEL